MQTSVPEQLISGRRDGVQENELRRNFATLHRLVQTMSGETIQALAHLEHDRVHCLQREGAGAELACALEQLRLQLLCLLPCWRPQTSVPIWTRPIALAL